MSRHLQDASRELDRLLYRTLEEMGDPPPERRIFVNRALRMESIQCVGFDLDWTLADYRRKPMERLAFDLAVDHLIAEQGYPEGIRAAELRFDFPRRGLFHRHYALRIPDCRGHD